MTPVDVEQRLNKIQDQLIEWLSKRTGVVLLFLMASTISTAYWFVALQLKFRFPFLYFSNFLFSFKTILLLASISLIFLFFKDLSRKTFFLVSVFVLGAVFDLWQSRWFLVAQEWLIVVFMFLQILFGYIAIKYSNEKNKYLTIGVYTVFSLGLIVFARFFTQLSGWYYFHQPVIFSAFIIVFIIEKIKPGESNLQKLMLNPAHLFLSVNYPIDSYLDDKQINGKKIWCSGYLDLIKSFMALYLTILTYHFIPAQSGLMVISIKNYLMYLLVVIAVGNTVTGISKLFLINIPVCSNFAFLSRSPLDFMKRENAHAYIFSFRFIYFNLLKYTRNPFVIVLGYFAVFPFYRNILIYFSRLEPFSWSEFGEFLMFSYIFWALLLGAIIIYPQKIIDKLKINQWGQLILTHILLLSVFYFFNLFYQGSNL